MINGFLELCLKHCGILFCRYGSLSFGEVVSFVPQKLDKVKIASVRRLAIREAVKVCTDYLCLCMPWVNFNILVFSSEITRCYSVPFSYYDENRIFPIETIL